MYRDAVVYLLELNATPIATDSYVIKFSKMVQSDEDYLYFKTAFDKKLIGKDTNPDAQIKCDNYIVMKGLLEGWDVSDYDGDIFEQYFGAAEDLGYLNGCVQGNYVYKQNL